jgi:hypothetical protein
MDWASELIIPVLLSMIRGLVGQPPILYFDTFLAVLEGVFWLFLGERSYRLPRKTTGTRRGL